MTIVGGLKGHVDGPATVARLTEPTDIAVGDEGRLYVVENTGRLRVIILGDFELLVFTMSLSSIVPNPTAISVDSSSIV